MSKSSYHCWSCNKNSIMVNIWCWHPASAQGWSSQWGVVIAGQYHIYFYWRSLKMNMLVSCPCCETTPSFYFFAFSSVLRLFPLSSVSSIMSICGHLWQLYPFWTSSSLLCFPSALLLCHYLEFLGDFMWKFFHLILVTFNHKYEDFSILIRVILYQALSLWFVVVQARTVVAENLPADHSIETIEQLFGKVGKYVVLPISFWFTVLCMGLLSS